MIKEINGRFTCTNCGHEWSAMLGDDEIPAKCSCKTLSKKLKTEIHWHFWRQGGRSVEVGDLKAIIRMIEKYPEAELVEAHDSENDSFIVLASGSLKQTDITAALDELN